MLLVQKHDRAVCCGCRLLHARFTAPASPAPALRQDAALGTVLTGPLRTLPLPRYVPPWCLHWTTVAATCPASLEHLPLLSS